MINYDKQQVKESLSTEDIFQLLQEWGGDPEYTSFGIICSTICHNEPGVGSRKLYYYENSGLFRCYTQCGEYFDVFSLAIKIFKIQKRKEIDLNEAIRWIAQKFNIAGEQVKDDEEQLEDWKILDNYNRIQEIEIKTNHIILQEYNSDILENFNYKIKIRPWLNEEISTQVLKESHIGFYPGDDQITIPHYDASGRFIGLRGRTLCKEEGERYGKYRPMKINGILYTHPLGMNLYNLNNSKENIKVMGKAFVFEGEKSALKFRSYFGSENDLSVACCGSSVSNYQIQLLIEAGAKEIIIALDRQFQQIGDNEFRNLKKNLLKIRDRYKNDVLISFIFDKQMLTGYKDSPIDCGKDIFLQLFKERIVL